MKFTIYDAVKDSLHHLLPKILDDVITIQSKVDALPDYPSYDQVGKAIGISTAKVSKYVKDMNIQPQYLKGGRTRRIHREDFKKLIIHQRYQQ